MSVTTIAPYFPFRRIKIVNQNVTPEATGAHIQVKPDKRYQPICHECGRRASGIHSWTRRKIRDLNLATARVWITCKYRKVFCAHCQGIHIEDLELFHPYLRVTTRLACYIYRLCQLITVSDVARHLGLDWKTVKAIDKHYLERDYGQPDCQVLRILAVDEISIRKGHRYLSVVLDYLSGRVVFVGKDRKAKILERFFNQLSATQRNGIKAVVMDMWDPFVKAVKKNCLRLKSYLICSTSWPISTALSIRSETVNIARPQNMTKPSIKGPSTCCLKTAGTYAAKAIGNNSKSCWR